MDKQAFHMGLPFRQRESFRVTAFSFSDIVIFLEDYKKLVFVAV